MLEIIFNALHGIFIEELPFWITIIAVFLIWSKVSSTNSYMDFKEKARRFIESGGGKISDIFYNIKTMIFTLGFLIVVVFIAIDSWEEADSIGEFALDMLELAGAVLLVAAIPIILIIAAQASPSSSGSSSSKSSQTEQNEEQTDPNKRHDADSHEYYSGRTCTYCKYYEKGFGNCHFNRNGRVSPADTNNYTCDHWEGKD